MGQAIHFCSQRGAANLFTGDQRGAVGTGLPCKRPPRATIQESTVGSWRASELASNVCPNESAEGVLPA